MSVSLARGIFDAFFASIRSLFKKRYTLRYPEQKLDLPDGYTFDPKTQVGSPGVKGRHILFLDKCTGCSLCAIACEGIADCIDMVKVDGTWPKNKKTIMPQIDYARCVFCGFCVDACPFDCLFMTPEYELASTDKRKLVHTPFQLGTLPEKKGLVEFIPEKRRGAHHD
ncbi:MAG: NuoI/complex I 23 kDa subunit family protein [Nitrososphaerales archaeon]